MDAFNYNVCDVCGDDHDTEQCPQLVLDDDDQLDDSTAFQHSRACVTLPHFLSLLSDQDGLLSVIAKEAISVRTRFGPFEARRTTHDIDASDSFVLKVFLKDGSSVSLDTSDPGGCNWLCLVPTARTEHAQNMMALQIGLDVYYTVTKSVSPGDCLCVWYAPHYARKLGQPVTPNGSTDIFLGRQLLPPMVSSVTNDGVMPVMVEPFVTVSGDPVDSKVIMDAAPTGDDFEQVEEPDGQITSFPEDLTDEPITGDQFDTGDADDSFELSPNVKSELESTEAVLSSLAKPRCLHIIHEHWPENTTQRRQCAHCDKSFDDIAELARHVRDHIIHQMKGQGQGRGRGRPRKRPLPDDEAVVVRRKRGRPPGSKNKVKKPEKVAADKNTETSQEEESTVEDEDTSINKEVTDESTHTNTSDSSPKQVGNALVLPPKEGMFTRGRTRKLNVKFVDVTDTVRSPEAKLKTNENLDSVETEVDESASNDLMASLISLEDVDLVPVDEADVTKEDAAGNDTADEVLSSLMKGDLYCCQYCGKSFEKLLYLQRHEEGHMASYQCTSCGKRYARKDSLMKHVCSEQVKLEAASHSNKDFYCEFCGAAFNSHKYLLRHMATHTREHACSSCGRAFARKESLIYHLSRCDPDQLAGADGKPATAIFPCTKCKRVFTREVSLQNHMHLHEGTFKCERCGRAFASQFSLDRHGICSGPLAADVGSGGGVKCRVCGREFSRELYLRRHMAVHTGQFTCSLCRRRFSRREELTKHMLECSATMQVQTTGKIQCAMCGDEFTEISAYQAHYTQHTHPYRCDKCDRVFLRKVNLESHACNPETGVPVDCDVCGKQFRHAKYLARHRLTHGTPQYPCDGCGRRFHRVDYYNDHTCVTETGERARIRRRKKADGTDDGVKVIMPPSEPLVCAICGKSYISTSNLNKHLKTHGEKLETCHVCGKSFHLKVALREHLRSVHTDEYRHECPHCGRRMKCRNSVYAHIAQFHASVSPKHVCLECGRSFRQKGNLKKHAQTHVTGRSSQYRCAKCSRGFRSADQLSQHVALCHTVNTLPPPPPPPPSAVKTEMPFVIADIQAVGDNGEAATHQTLVIQSADGTSSGISSEHVVNALQGLITRPTEMMTMIDTTDCSQMAAGSIDQSVVGDDSAEKSGFIVLPMFAVQNTDEQMTM